MYCTVLYCTVLCCVVLRCAVLCYTVLCCALPCCAVLCCAVLCWTGLDWTGLDWTGLDWTGLDWTGIYNRVQENGKVCPNPMGQVSSNEKCCKIQFESRQFESRDTVRYRQIPPAEESRRGEMFGLNRSPPAVAWLCAGSASRFQEIHIQRVRMA